MNKIIIREDNNKKIIHSAVETVQLQEVTPTMNINVHSGNFPIVEKTIYVLNNNAFETMEELTEFSLENGISIEKAYKLDYIRYFAGRFDVIRKTNYDKTSVIMCAVTDDIYDVYDDAANKNNSMYIWKHLQGNLSSIYELLRNSGVEFDNDLFMQLEKRNQRLLRICSNKYLTTMQLSSMHDQIN